MIDGNYKQPEVGDWWAICCHHDLMRIENAEDLEEVNAWIADEDIHVAGVWPTRREALLEIRSRWKDDRSLAEIDAMLAQDKQ